MRIPFRRSLKASVIGFAVSTRFHNRFRRFGGRLAILNYHRVLPTEEFDQDRSPNRGLAVSAPSFEAQMAYVGAKYACIGLDEVPEFLASGSDAFRVAVTFDDGYRDNLLHALPILRHFGIPATIYVTTRFPEGHGQLWWYELWQILSESPKVEAEWLTRRRRWDTSSDALRRRAFAEIRATILSLNRSSQDDFLTALRGGREPIDYTSQFLSWDEIRELDKDPLITIGAHTHTHPNLRHCSPQELVEELTHSKQLLERHLGHPVHHLAYPFGGPGETNETVFSAARECGYQTAVTTLLGAVNPSRLLALPRLVILDEHDPMRLDITLSGLPIALGRPL